MNIDISLTLLINLALLLAGSWLMFLWFALSRRKAGKVASRPDLASTNAVLLNQQQELDDLQQQLTASQSTVERQQQELAQLQAIPVLHPHGEPDATAELQQQLQTLQSENQALRQQLEQVTWELEDLAEATAHPAHRQQDELLTGLHTKLDQVQQEVRDMAKPDAHRAPENSPSAGLAAIESTLVRTENERQCIEQHYMELSEQLDVAEQFGARSQKECAQLEQAYLDLVAEVEQAGEASAQAG